MPCNAVSYQRAFITDEELIKLLPHDALARVANYLREKGYSVSVSDALVVSNATATARVAMISGVLEIASPSQKLIATLTEQLKPVLRAIAAQELQRRVATFIYENAPVRRAERAPNGALIIHADVRLR